jgi:hypothetical protein
MTKYENESEYMDSLIGIKLLVFFFNSSLSAALLLSKSLIKFLKRANKKEANQQQLSSK